jgi:hypothetical protein
MGTMNLEMDHIKPLCARGPNTIRNVRPVCSHCNYASYAEHRRKIRERRAASRKK